MKIVVAILLFLFSLIGYAQADICYDINPAVSNKALDIIQEQQEIYIYCSICTNATPQTVQITQVKSGNPIYVNNIPLDLAHTYYKQNDKFLNLGIASGCIKADQYNISAELHELAVNKNQIDAKEQAKQQAHETFQKCKTSLKNDQDSTTHDIIVSNKQLNDCLMTAIKQEIQKGFDQKQQKQILEYLSQTRENYFKLYHTIYANNKYCYGSCGSVTPILPYSDEYNLLIEVLERLIYLNITKNGY